MENKNNKVSLQSLFIGCDTDTQDKDVENSVVIGQQRKELSSSPVQLINCTHPKLLLSQKSMDKESKKDRFGWIAIEGTHLPYIFRYTMENT